MLAFAFVLASSSSSQLNMQSPFKCAPDENSATIAADADTARYRTRAASRIHESFPTKENARMEAAKQICTRFGGSGDFTRLHVSRSLRGIPDRSREHSSKVYH